MKGRPTEPLIRDVTVIPAPLSTGPCHRSVGRLVFAFEQPTDCGQQDRVRPTKGYTVKIVVISGTGLIGSKLVAKLRKHGHQAVPAAPKTGVNTLSGEGLAEVLEGAAVVVDVSNSPLFADDPVLEFFRTSAPSASRASNVSSADERAVSATDATTNRSL